jgi:prefoldin subunit 5
MDLSQYSEEQLAEVKLAVASLSDQNTSSIADLQSELDSLNAQVLIFQSRISELGVSISSLTRLNFLISLLK